MYHNLFHTPPPSVEAADWISFDKFTTDVFKRDFCHDHHITVNARIPTTKEGYVKVKQELRWKSPDLHINDQLRFWFPLTWRRQSYIYAHKINDKIKVHYDNGFSQAGNYSINAYASLDFLKDFSKYSVNIGASHTNDRVYTDTRLRLYNDKSLVVYHKTHLRFNEWKFGFDAVVDLAQKALIKKDLAIGYEHPKFSAYIKAEQAWDKPTEDFNKWKDFFSTISLTFLHRRNAKELYGIEVVTNPHDKAITETTVLAEYRHSERSRVKAKLNTRTLLTLLLERQINSQLSARLGIRLPIDNSSFRKEEKKGRAGLELSWNL